MYYIFWHLNFVLEGKKMKVNFIEIIFTNQMVIFFVQFQASMKAMTAQKFQKVSNPSHTKSIPIVSSSNYKCIPPTRVGDVTKPGGYVVTPSVLTVTNNS